MRSHMENILPSIVLVNPLVHPCLFSHLNQESLSLKSVSLNYLS